MNEYLHRLGGLAVLAVGLFWLVPAAAGQVVVVTQPTYANPYGPIWSSGRAFYTPLDNVRYSPALNYQVPTAVPASANYPANYNPVTTPMTTGVYYNGYYPTSLPTAYNPAVTTATSTTLGPTVVPLLSSATYGRPMVGTGRQESERSEDKRIAVSTGNKPDRLISHEDRDTAFIDLAVPANAEVWFQGIKTRQQGNVRRFASPPLTEGRPFVYDIRVRWTANGRAVTRSHRLTVRRGDWWQVDMTAARKEAVSLPLEAAAR